METGTTKIALRILHLEDNPDDQMLIKKTLADDGLNCRIQYVTSCKEFESALKEDKFDLIISDFTLPSYDGTVSLAAALKLQMETPFVLLSGTIGEERAVEFLKNGAADCVLKHNLARLGPAVRRALREADERAKRKTAEEALANQAAQLRALAARLQASREEERIRIAREIHDELGEALTAQKFGLTWIRQRLAARDGTISWEQVFEKVDSLKTLADETANRVRKLCTELRPSILDDLGLVAVIEWQVREFQTRTNIRCELIQRVGALTLDGEKATAVFRIFQEILTNVARHAHASKVLVMLKVAKKNLILQVKDNGKGINENKIAVGGSLGILGMRERAILLGGQFIIRGAPAKGTTVTVSIPLDTSDPKPDDDRQKQSRHE
jgi:signal transduction histidine kinase